MTDPFYRLPSDTTNTGKRVDNDQVNDGTNDLLRQNIVTADPTDVLGKQKVLNTNPAGTEYGAVVRNIPSGTQPVSAASLPLPSGAATAAKQPALGSAGTASSDVLTVQGIASMTALKVDGSAATQPIINSDISAIATATGTQADVAWVSGNGTIISLLKGIFGKFGSFVLAAGTALIGYVKITDGTNFMPTMDAVARPGFQKITDGTNTLPTMDVAARAAFMKLTDGTNFVSLNSTTYTAKFGLDSNLLGTLGTAFSTPGKVDIKGADGDVFIRQATASNLNATVVGAKTNNSAAPSTNNIGSLPAVANAAAPSWSEGNQTSLSVDLGGNQRVRLVGCTPYLLSNLKTVVTAVSSAAGMFCLDDLFSIDAVPAYLQCFDQAAGGSITLGTTVPNFVLGIPSNATASNGIATRGERTKGYIFANGLKLAATTTPTGATTSVNGLNGTIGTSIV